MENIFYKIEFWNLCLAILALVISVCTYFKHDKTLKEQESQINEYHLKQLEKEVGMSKKAHITGNTHRDAQVLTHDLAINPLLVRVC